MELFTIDSKEVHDAFLVFKMVQFNTQFANKDHHRWWINGVKESQKWFSYNPDRKSLFEGVSWYKGSNYTDGDCLMMVKDLQSANNTLGQTDCTNIAWLMCEYLPNEAKTTTTKQPLGPSGFGPSGFGPSGFGPSGFGQSSFDPSGFAPPAFGPRLFVAQTIQTVSGQSIAIPLPLLGIEPN